VRERVKEGEESKIERKRKRWRKEKRERRGTIREGETAQVLLSTSI
jgi:hypothetical protein